MPKLLLVVFGLIFSFMGISQDFSNKGKDFWVAYAGHIDATSSRMALYISSDQNTTGTVELAGTTIPFTVTANQATVVQIYPTTYNVYNSQSDGINVGRGIHIVSAKPIVVYAHILNSARSGSTLVLPTNTLGREYICIAYKQTNNQTTAKSQFTIVGVEDNTSVEITPSVASIGNTRPANVPFNIILNKGDVYQFQSNTDVTGSKIKSLSTGSSGCKPLAVFSGSTWNYYDCGTGNSGDNLYQQLFPFASWGKSYVTAPFISRSYDIFRVLVKDPTTVVTLNGGILPNSTLVNNTYYEFKGSQANIVTSDKPVLVIQYMTTGACTPGANVGDPEMIILNAVEQTLNSVTVLSARRDLTPPNTNITSHYLNIITKASSLGSIRIDGAPPTATPQAIAGSNYVFFQQDVTNSTQNNPTHTIVGDSGFIAIAYGMGNVESYGYNAGTNVKDLYQFVSLQNQYATVNFPATCKGSPFLFSITLPYLPTSLTWDFSNNPNLSPNTSIVNNSPVADSTFIRDGRTLYVFKLPGNFSFSAAGTYPIKVIVNNPTPDGCSGVQEISYDVEVYEAPRVDWSVVSTGCLSDSLRFTDLTNGNGRPAAKWLWNFGDNTTDTVKNPVKKYAASGTYNVRLTAVTDVGCISDTTKPVTINPEPIALFDTSGFKCVNSSITFTDRSTILSGTIVKWNWDFGDGTLISSATNVTQVHAYATSGTYIAKLVVEGTGGCKSIVFQRTIVITPTPFVDFTLPSICLPSGTGQFNSLSTISDGTSSSFIYAWSFGDGGSSTLQNPIHQFTSVGPFDIKLTVTSAAGCTKDTTKRITTIYNPPVANFNFANPAGEVCLRDTTAFVNTSNANGNPIVKWYWDFGDGATDTVANPRHLYTTANTYVIKMVVVNDKGCVSDTFKQSLVVMPLPTALFNTSVPECEGNNITITDQSYPGARSLTNWDWTFGDGTSASYTNANPFNKIYSIANSYTIKLVVTTSSGCKSDTAFKTIKVNSLPVANFTMPEVCLSDAFAEFKDSSYATDGSLPFTYLWNFGDVNATPANPNTSNAANPRHKYSATGIYNVSLTVTNANGCSSTSTKAFTVNGSVPKANFAVIDDTKLCSNKTVTIQNTSSVDFGVVTAVEITWDNTNSPGTVFVDQNPAPNKLYTHNYPSLLIGTSYSIRFKAFSGASCVSEIVKQIQVNGSPKVNFTALPDACFNDKTYNITQASELSGLAGSFTFSGKGVSPAGVFNAGSAGVGPITLQYKYTTTQGCSDSASQSFTVYPNPTVNAGTDLYILEGGKATINSIASGSALRYRWSPALYLDNDTIARPVTSPLANISYKITVTSQGGCTAFDEVNIIVLKAPVVPSAFSPNGDGINDVWNIRYLESYAGSTVEVFNRYGQPVFRSTGYNTPWDGKFNGTILPVGTYYYIINPKNGRSPYSGSVTIIR